MVLMRLGLALVVVLGGTATAQPADPDALVLEGSARAAQRDHLGAVDLYRRAYAIDGDVALLPIIGVEYRRAGRPLEAVQYFCTYLYMSPGGPAAADATAQAREIELELGYPSEPAHHICTPVDWAPFSESARAAPVAAAPVPVPGTHLISNRELVGIAAAGAGGVLLGVGLAFHAQAQHDSDLLAHHDPSQPWSADTLVIERRGMAEEDRARVLVIAGSAALATGVVLYITGRQARLAEHFTVVPTSSGGGVTVHGRF